MLHILPSRMSIRLRLYVLVTSGANAVSAYSISGHQRRPQTLHPLKKQFKEENMSSSEFDAVYFNSQIILSELKRF